jgi:curved DNA-binding protein
MKFKDYYEVLGLTESASGDEIKSAYRRLARKFHPDVSKEKNAEDRFKAINEAYEALKDPEKRKSYDDLKRGGFRAGDDFRPPPGWNPHGGFGQDSADAQSAGFSDFFESLFGGGGGGRRPQRGPSRRGADVTARLQIDLETAFAGGAQRVSLTRGGDQKSLDVKIPAGIQNGQTIRLTGQGEPGAAGAGDLLLEIEIPPHPRYERDGRDVVLRLPIAPWEAALGATVEVPTLAGPVGLRVPEGSATGKRLRLKGRGMPGATPGDQYVVLEIQTPPASDEAQRRFYEQMRETFAFDPRSKL